MASYEVQFTSTSPWAEMWQNPEADASVLTAMLLHKYGEQVLDWDPMTIRLEIQDDFHVSPVDEVMNKICAMQIVLSSDAFFTRVDSFINVCNTLSEGDPFFEVFTPLEAEEVALALSIVAMNRDMLPFNPTIKRLIKEILKEEGFTDDSFPEIFSVVFDKNPSAKETRHEVAETIISSAADSNEQNIKNMLTSHVGVMMSQLAKIPELKMSERNSILEDGVLLALGITKKPTA